MHQAESLAHPHTFRRLGDAAANCANGPGNKPFRYLHTDKGQVGADVDGMGSECRQQAIHPDFLPHVYGLTQDATVKLRLGLLGRQYGIQVGEVVDIGLCGPFQGILHTFHTGRVDIDANTAGGGRPGGLGLTAEKVGRHLAFQRHCHHEVAAIGRCRGATENQLVEAGCFSIQRP